MSWDRLFTGDSTWASPIVIPFNAMMLPSATLDTGAWSAANQGVVNEVVAKGGGENAIGATFSGAVADVASLHTRREGDIVTYIGVDGLLKYYNVPDTRTSPYMTETVWGEGTVSVVGGTVLVSNTVTCFGIELGDSLIVQSTQDGIYTLTAVAPEIELTGEHANDFHLGATDRDTATNLCAALNTIPNISPAKATLSSAGSIITITDVEARLELAHGIGQHDKFNIGTQTRTISGGTGTYVGDVTSFGNATLFDNLIMPTQTGQPNSILDAAILELAGTSGAMDSLGLLTSVGFEANGAMAAGKTNAPQVTSATVGISATALQAAFDAALVEIKTGHISELWPGSGSMPSDLLTTTGTACTDTTIASIPDLVTAAVAAQQAAALDDEDIEAQRMAESFQNLRGAAFGTGFDTAMANFRAKGVRARAADASRMHMDSLTARATAAMKQAELTAQAKATSLEAARITLEAQQSKANMKFQEMVSKIQAVMTIGKGISDATLASAELAAQVGIALASEYTRNFGTGFNHLATKADVLGKLCQLRNLKVEHELRDKLWNVELFPYWAGAMGAPGAATVKKPSAFDNLIAIGNMASNGLGTLANVAGAGLNVYAAFK